MTKSHEEKNPIVPVHKISLLPIEVPMLAGTLTSEYKPSHSNQSTVP